MSNFVMLNGEVLTSYVDFIKKDDRILYPITSIDAVYDTSGYNLKDYLASKYQARGSYALNNHNHDSVYAKTNHNHDGSYITPTALNTKIQSEGVTAAFTKFTVGGDANKYYPVVFLLKTANYVGQVFRIGRRYNDVAPDTWNTPTHRGGLTLDFLLSGDVGWGGNSKDIVLLHFDETYSSMVADAYWSTDGFVVWLRGGGAVYYAGSDLGACSSIKVNLSEYTDQGGGKFPVKTAVVSNWFRKYYIVNVYKPTLGELGAAASNHTHPTIPKTTLQNNGTSWIDGIRGKVPCLYMKTNSETSYHPAMSLTDYYNNSISFGILSSNFFISGAYHNRTANGTDYQHTINMATGDVNFSKNVAALRFKEGSQLGRITAVQSGTPVQNSGALWAW